MEQELRKRTREVREREREMSTLLSNLPGMVYRCANDRDWTMEYVSEGCYSLTGYCPEEMLRGSITYNDLVLPEYREGLWQKWQGLLAQQAPFEEEYPIRAASGDIKWVWERGCGVFSETGELLFLEGYIEDITARKQAQDMLRQNEARFESLYQIAQYSAASAKDLLDFALDRAIALTGSTIGYIYFYSEQRQEFTLNTWSKEVMKECSVQNSQTVYQLAKTGIWGEAVRQRRPIIVNDFTADNPLKKGCPQGHAVLKKFMTVPVFSGERIAAVVGVANKQTDYNDDDIRQLQLLMDGVWKIVHQRELEAERSLLISAIEQAAEIFLIMDVDGAVQYVNAATERITGYSRQEVLGSGKFFYARFPERSAMYDEVLQRVKSGATWAGRILEKQKDGTPYELEITITPICDASGLVTSLVSIGRDITQERRLEEQLLQSQKMEAIGTLAGGIAHDFNNILGGIIGYAEAAKEKLGNGHPGRAYLEQILKASDRAAALVKQILAFSRKTQHERRSLRMHQIVREALQLLRASIPATVHILEHLCREGDVILADPNQMHQVLMNLCTNAAHAMGERGGLLTIELEPVCLAARDLCQYPGLKAGAYVRLTVSDTGIGINPEIIGRIFDPFFTTKGQGQGTGMGLAVVHGIIAGHNGSISVKSTPDRGTAFCVMLPCTDEGIVADEEPAYPLPTGTEHILYVDDEESLVEIEQSLLESLGYSVTACTSPEQAYDLFTRRPTAFDLIITDHAMPHMSGYDFAQKVMCIRQDIPVIMCTGFSEPVSREQAKSAGIREFMLKPMKREGLARAVRRVLDAG